MGVPHGDGDAPGGKREGDAGMDELMEGVTEVPGVVEMLDVTLIVGVTEEAAVLEILGVTLTAGVTEVLGVMLIAGVMEMVGVMLMVGDAEAPTDCEEELDKLRERVTEGAAADLDTLADKLIVGVTDTAGVGLTADVAETAIEGLVHGPYADWHPSPQ